LKGALLRPQPTRARQPTNATVASAARDMDFSDETRIRMSGRGVAHGSPPGFGVSPSVGVTRLTHADHAEETAERETTAKEVVGRLNRLPSNHRPGILQEVDKERGARPRSRRAHMTELYQADDEQANTLDPFPTSS
jgi:hypothetical protein